MPRAAYISGVRVTIKNAAIADVATANATDLPTSQALANQLKTTTNLMLAAMRLAGIIA